MNFRQLEIFRAVMVSGTASRASELLQVSQPAISRGIAELERALGFSLFDRVRGRLVPTPEGRLFFRDVDASFAGLDRLRSSAASIRDFGSGSIRIASLAALGSTLVPRAICAFRKAHPQIAITLQILPSSQVREMVAERQFDVGLAADEVDLSGIEHRPFASYRAVCALPAGHPLASRKSIAPQDLHDLPFIALSPEDQARKRMVRIFEAAGSRPQIVVETPNSATVCALVSEGVGLGLVNPAAAERYKKDVVFRPFEPGVYFTAIMLFRPDAQKTRLVKRFVGHLLDARRVQIDGA